MNFVVSMLASLNTRPPAKLATEKEFAGDTERRTTAYLNVREDSSTGSTYKLLSVVEFTKRSNDQVEVEIPELGLVVKIRRTSRAKNVQIKISNGQAILVIPKASSSQRAMTFLHSRLDWIAKNLAKQQKIDFAENSSITILGKKYDIIYTNSLQGRIELKDNQLLVHAKSINLERRIKKFLSSMLLDKITTIAKEISLKLGVSFKKITVKDISSKWGSCSSLGNLSFALKLIFTTEEALRYVVAHEVCHLVEMNHSKRFWALVGSVYPEWQSPALWLKQHGKDITLD